MDVTGAEKTTPNKHQQLYKQRTPNWKDTYRKRCVERLKKSRDAFVGRFRNLSTNPNTCGASLVEDVMQQEWQLMRGNADGMEMVGNSEDVDGTLAVFAEIRAELLMEEQQILREYEQARLFEEAEVSAAVGHLGEDHVICPVCQKNTLSLYRGVILCPCGLRIDTEQDCLTLKNVKHNLNEGATLHSSQCTETPSFGIVSPVGIPNLLMTCDSCDFMFIII